MLYKFETVTTMKPYNARKYWIDEKIVTPKLIEAPSVEKALKQFQDLTSEEDYIKISDNAIKNKSPRFLDIKGKEPIQTGYVITASTEIQDDNFNFTKQFIDLWINIAIIENPFIKEAIKSK